MVVWGCLRWLLTKLHIFDTFAFFTRGLLVMSWRLFAEIVENRRKSSKIVKNRKMEVRKVDFSTPSGRFSRSPMLPSDSGAKIGSRMTPNSKMRFSRKKSQKTSNYEMKIIDFEQKCSKNTVIGVQKLRFGVKKYFCFRKRSEILPCFENGQNFENRSKTWVFRAELRF